MQQTGQGQLPEYPLWQAVLLHLFPGAIFTIIVAVVASLVEPSIDGVFVLFGAIGLILVPIELGYLALYARRNAGTWSPMAAVIFRQRLPARRLVMMTAGLVAWFLAVLVISIALLDRWLADNVFGWMPETLRQFAGAGEENGQDVGGRELALFLVIAFAFNGIAGPVTEELYFRGHLLLRLQRYGGWAPVINTVLFAVYHFFSPWRYPAIIIGFLPIAWFTWKHRSLYLSVAAHVTINCITVVLIAAAALAGQ